MDKQVKRIMADVLNLDQDAIGAATAQESVDTWDSLKHITLCLALEEEFGVSFDVEEIESMVSYCDVVRILKRKL